MIELRSDTFTQPTAEMRLATSLADVGDDVYREDPTVIELEALGAERAGKPAALLMPSGTMANLAAIMTHATRGGKVILGSETDAYIYEAGGASVCGGVVYAPVTNLADGTLDADELTAQFDVDVEDPQFARPALICLENTHNRCGGKALPLAYLRDIQNQARAWGVPVHLDGARLFNAATALHTTADRIAYYADSVQFCLSKGLSAPIGSILAGETDFIESARRARKMLGGGMRQAGVVAAPGIVALEQMVDRLADDHANAQRLAQGLDALAGVELIEMPQTNIVMFRVSTEQLSQDEFIERMLAAGVGLAELGHGRVRAVTHSGLSSDDIDRALSRMKDVLA